MTIDKDWAEISTQATIHLIGRSFVVRISMENYSDSFLTFSTYDFYQFESLCARPWRTVTTGFILAAMCLMTRIGLVCRRIKTTRKKLPEKRLWGRCCLGRKRVNELPTYLPAEIFFGLKGLIISQLHEKKLKPDALPLPYCVRRQWTSFSTCI